MGSEAVRIPNRIYNDELSRERADLSNLEQLVLACVYTRHHDGYVRQRSVERILPAAEQWVVPFVIQLIGEYVVEILEVIAEQLGNLPEGDVRREPYTRFVRNNPTLMNLTAARVASYWNCYCRREWPRLQGSCRPGRYDYPGYRLLTMFSNLE